MSALATWANSSRGYSPVSVCGFSGTNSTPNTSRIMLVYSVTLSREMRADASEPSARHTAGSTPGPPPVPAVPAVDVPGLLPAPSPEQAATPRAAPKSSTPTTSFFMQHLPGTRHTCPLYVSAGDGPCLAPISSVSVRKLSAAALESAHCQPSCLDRLPRLPTAQLHSPTASRL